jgi:hypothetical protein
MGSFDEAEGLVRAGDATRTQQQPRAERRVAGMIVMWTFGDHPPSACDRSSTAPSA